MRCIWSRPGIRRSRARPQEDGVRFHFYKYAPTAGLNVFGYAGGLRADTAVRGAAWIAAPFGLGFGWLAARRVAARYRATVMHGHWVIPSGFLAALRAAVAAARRQSPRIRRVRRRAQRSGSPRGARGVRPRRLDHGVQRRPARSRDCARREARSHRDRAVRRRQRRASARIRRRARRCGANWASATRRWSSAPDAWSARKGFEYLIDAADQLGDLPGLTVAIAGEGDLRESLAARAARSGGRVRLLGNRSQDDIARLCAAADVDRRPVDARRRGQCRRPAELRARSAGVGHAGGRDARGRPVRRRSTTAGPGAWCRNATRPHWRQPSARCWRTRNDARTLGAAARADVVRPVRMEPRSRRDSKRRMGARSDDERDDTGDDR